MLKGSTGVIRDKSQPRLSSQGSCEAPPAHPYPPSCRRGSRAQPSRGPSCFHTTGCGRTGRDESITKGQPCLPPGSSLSLKGSSTSTLLALASLSQLGIT